MGTRIQALALLLAGGAFFVGHSSALAQPSSADMSLNETLYRSVCQRVQTPVVFSTRDTLFALSLPTDEPARIYLELTVGKNGKVKEKLTKVHANHIAGYVAPAFVAATKDLRIDRSLLAAMQGKDTAVLLAFPLEYQCVYDTVNKAQPEEELNRIIASSFHPLDHHPITRPIPASRRNKYLEGDIASYPSYIEEQYRKMPPSQVWYYLAFIKGQQQ